MNSCGIYAIVSPSGNGYIGSSVRIEKRKVRHFYELRHGVHHCIPLQEAWNKYDGQLKFVVIELCSRETLREREQFWIDHPIFLKLYNLAANVVPGLHLTEATKRKISDSTMGKRKSDETRMRMRKPKSAAHAAAISAGKKGRVPVFSEAAKASRRAKISVPRGPRPPLTPQTLANVRAGVIRRMEKRHMAMLNWIVSA